MTPVEKAKDLIGKFLPHAYPFSAGSGYLTGDIDESGKLQHAKEIALIAVETHFYSENEAPFLTMSEWIENNKFWNEVKTELTK